MKNSTAKQLGEKLKAELEQLKVMAKEARAARDPDAEVMEYAIINLSAAIEILTD